MKKFLALLGVFAISSLAYAHMHKHERELWCEQNWERCRELKLKALSVREKYIAKERECVQKAKDYWAMKECVASIKVQKKREMRELWQSAK